MEDYDELSAGPDKDGSLCLSHNSWKLIPNELFDFASRIRRLDFSRNNIFEISPLFGRLVLLEVRIYIIFVVKICCSLRRHFPFTYL